MGAPAIGSVYLWLEAKTLTGLESASSADTVLRCEGADWFGMELDVGDLDGDHIADLVVGAPDYDHLTGASSWADAPGEIYVFSGATLETGTISSGQASASIGGVSDTDLFGTTVVVGDLSGNGVDELLVAAPRAGGSHEGYVWVFDNL